MARLFLEPTELLLVIGLVLLGVQARQPCRDRLPLLLPLAWSLGGLCGLTLPSELLLALPCTALVAVIGLLVVLEVRLRPAVLLPLAAALALLFALAAGSALTGHPGALAPPHPRWRSIGLRVAGSWITAASLLMLGWLIRHPQ